MDQRNLLRNFISKDVMTKRWGIKIALLSAYLPHLTLYKISTHLNIYIGDY